MSISVVIPAYNEEGNLRLLVDSLLEIVKKNRLESEIVIVDDNSTDRTPRIADELTIKHKNVVVVHRTKGNKGMGNSLIEGTRKARGKIVVWVMGDRSDNLKTIPLMIKKISEGYDIVFGARYIPGGSSGDLDPWKVVASSGYTSLARLVFGFRVHDITNAFRAFRKVVFERIRLESGDFAISPEFAIKAHLKGYRLGEVPTTYSNRRAGKTKFKMLKMGLRYLSLLRYRFFLS